MAEATAGMDVHVDLRDGVSQGLKTIQSGIIRFVGAITAASAAIAAVGYPIRSAVGFERAMADIAKTTGFTDAQITRLGKSLLKLSTTTSRSALELAQIAAVAGQLGLGTRAGAQGILEFTEVVGEAATALNILEEEAAKMGATIINIFKFNAGDARRIFSVINELSNTSVATGEQIADIVSRIGSIAGLEFPQVAALAAYSKDLGVSTEVAGTSFVKIFTRMLSSAENFSTLLQMSTEEWIGLIEKDAIGALKKAAEAVSKLGGAAQATAINKLFGQGRVYALTAKVVEDAGNQFRLLDQHVAAANTQMIEGTSIAKEFAAIMGTTEEQVKQTGNVITALATTSGQGTLPVIKQILEDLREWASDPVTQEFFLNLGEQLAGFIDWLARAGKAIAQLGIDWGGLTKALLYIIGFFLLKWAVKVYASLSRHLVSLGAIQKKWQSLTAAVLLYGKAVDTAVTKVGNVTYGAGSAPAPAAADKRAPMVYPTTAQRKALAEEQKITKSMQVLLKSTGVLHQDISKHKENQLRIQKDILEGAKRERAGRTLIRQQAESALSTAERENTVSSQRLAVLREQALASQKSELEARKTVRSQAAIIGRGEKVTAQQKASAANATVIASKYKVWNGQLAKTLPLTTRIGAALTALKAAATGFFVGAILPSLALMAVFTAISAAIGFLALKWSQMSNERKRQAREEAAAERERQQALSDSLSLANEYYASLQSTKSEQPDEPAFIDTEKNMAALRGFAIESARAAAAEKGFADNIEETNKSIIAQEEELARLIARNEELQKDPRSFLKGAVPFPVITPFSASPFSNTNKEYEENLQLIAQAKLGIEQTQAASKVLQDRLEAIQQRSDVIGRNLVEMIARPVTLDPAVITEPVRQFERLSEAAKELEDQLADLRAAPDFEMDLSEIERVESELNEVHDQIRQARADIVSPRELTTPGLPPEVEYQMQIVEAMAGVNREIGALNKKRRALLKEDPATQGLRLDEMAPWLKEFTDTGVAEYEELNRQVSELKSRQDKLVEQAEGIAASGGAFSQILLEAVKGVVSGDAASLDIAEDIVKNLRESQEAAQARIDNMTDAQKAETSILQDAVRAREEELRILSEIGLKEVELKELRRLRDAGEGGQRVKDSIADMEEYIVQQRIAIQDYRVWRLMQEEASAGNPELSAELREIATAESERLNTARERLGMATVELENQKKLGAEYVLQYASLQLQRRTMVALASELQYMTDAAKGFADNVGSWSINLKQQAASALQSIDALIRERDYDIIADFEIKGIDKELEDLEEEAKEKFSEMRKFAIIAGDINALRRVDKEEKDYVERRKGELEVNRAVAERNALLGKQERLHDSIQDKIDRFNEIAGSADLNDQFEYDRLTKDVENSIPALQQMIETMVTARREVEGGQDVPLFTQEQIDAAKARLASLYEQLDTSRVRNAPIRVDVLSGLLGPISEEISGIDAQISEFPKKMAELQLSPKILESWREVLPLMGDINRAIEGLVDPINLVKDGVDGIGGGFDLNNILDTGVSGWFASFKSDLGLALGGVDPIPLSQWLDVKITETEKQKVKEAGDAVRQLWLDELRKREREEQGLNVDVGANIDTTTIQPDINKGKYYADVVARVDKSGLTGYARGGPINTDMATTGGFARGGPITGPGTATSDSILSWLSNGEYVIDSWTTRFFGSGFFKTLQSLARAGVGRSIVGKLGLPGFARGGPVRMALPQFPELAQLASSAASGSTTVTASDTINLNLSIGGGTYAVQGQRDQVRGLVGALKATSRGSVK